MAGVKVLRWLWVGVVCLCWGGVAWADAQDMSSEQWSLWERAEGALREGKLGEAERLTQEARVMGEHPFLGLLLGKIRLKQGDCAQAKELGLGSSHTYFLEKPGTNSHENERYDLLEQIARQCPARLRLECGPRSQAFLDGAATACGVEVVVEPGVHILTASDERGQEARPRRIQTDGEALTELKLYPAGGEYEFARWEPTSPQPIPEQDPKGEAYSDGLFMPIFMLTTGVVLVGAGGLAIWGATEVQTEGLEGEELQEAEILEIQGWSYGVMGVVAGLLNLGLGLVFWPEEPPPSKWPGFSLTPLGDGWGVGVGARF